MVGWSRRNRESRERQAAWWATLSEEEKTEYRRHQAEVDRKFNIVFAGILMLSLTLWAVLLWKLSLQHQ